MVALGKRNNLKILREAVPGLYLDGGDLGDILLPRRYVTPSMRQGDVLDVFVYLDSEDRLVATTEFPFAMVGEVGFLRVVSVNRQVGAFLDWGLSRDLLLPFQEQTDRVTTGQWLIVYLFIDQRSSRIAATMQLDRVLDQTPPPYEPGQKVGMLLTDRTPLGCKVIVENAHRGLLYAAGAVGGLEAGRRMFGYVGAKRPDGKLDVSLDPAGYQRIAPLTEQILEAMRNQGGRMDFDDQTPPEVIREAFGVSKKAFKQALGALFKQRRIIFTQPGIQIVESPAKRH